MYCPVCGMVHITKSLAASLAHDDEVVAASFLCRYLRGPLPLVIIIIID